MNCSNCGRHKQKKNLLDGVCRTCRREALGKEIFLRSDPMSEWAQSGDETPTTVYGDFPEPEHEWQTDHYEPAQNAQPEGQDLPLEAFSRLHHNQQTKYLKDRGVEWKPGEDRLELFKCL